jgi:hypothetical protein
MERNAILNRGMQWQQRRHILAQKSPLKTSTTRFQLSAVAPNNAVADQRIESMHIKEGERWRDNRRNNAAKKQ